MRRKLLSAALVAFPIVAQAAPTPGNITVINRPDVELKDLFGDIGVKADLVLGAAPPPGGQYTVGPRQLREIAEQYKVPLPVIALSEGVTIKRAGTAVSKKLIIAAIEHGLQALHVQARTAVILSKFTAPVIPANDNPNVVARKIIYDSLSHSFLASMSLTWSGADQVFFDVAGYVVKMSKVVVASHRLNPEEVITRSDVALRLVPFTGSPDTVLTDPSKAYGKELTVTVVAGQPLPAGKLATPLAVTKGATIALSVQVPGLAVEVSGVALASGCIGSVVPVLNPVSRDVIQAYVTAPNQAEVRPDLGLLPRSVSNSDWSHGNDSYYIRRRRT